MPLAFSFVMAYSSTEQYSRGVILSHLISLACKSDRKAICADFFFLIRRGNAFGFQFCNGVLIHGTILTWGHLVPLNQPSLQVRSESHLCGFFLSHKAWQCLWLSVL